MQYIGTTVLIAVFEIHLSLQVISVTHIVQFALYNWRIYRQRRQRVTIRLGLTQQNTDATFSIEKNEYICKSIDDKMLLLYGMTVSVLLVMTLT